MYCDWDLGCSYQNDTLSPSSSPLAAEERDPVAMTPDAGSDGDLRVHLNAHAEVQLQRRRGNLQ